MIEEYLSGAAEPMLRKLSHQSRLAFDLATCARLYLRFNEVGSEQVTAAADRRVAAALYAVLRAFVDGDRSFAQLESSICEVFPEEMIDTDVAYYFGVGVSLCGLVMPEYAQRDRCTSVARIAIDSYLGHIEALPEPDPTDELLVRGIVPSFGSDAYEDMAVTEIADQLRLLDRLLAAPSSGVQVVQTALADVQRALEAPY